MRFKLYLAAFISISAIFCGAVGSVDAATFDPNRIIDDSIFDNSTSMDPAAINNFLNGFPYSCISPNSGFQARVPSGYSPSGGFQFGDYGSAGDVIYAAAHTYGLNPQVVITTLEKEQNLVTGRSSSTYCNGDNHKYAAAAGFGCPDSGTTYSYRGLDLYRRNGVTQTDVDSTCVNTATKAGFSQQVIRAAWLLKFGEQRSRGNIGWAVVQGNWDNSDDPQSCYGGPMTNGTFQRCPSGATAYYDGYTTIDSTATMMSSGGTAALYWYTPHFHGNQLFFDLFNSWFGSTWAAYGASNYSQSPNYSEGVGWSRTVEFSFRNTGGSTWYDDSHLPAGTGAVHLAITSPINKNSPLDFNWPAANRPNKTFTKVYEADGTTLAADQHSVQPGQIAQFEFQVQIPENFITGVYRLDVQPIVEGTPYWNMGAVSSLDINVTPSYLSTLTYCPAPVDVKQNDLSNFSLRFVNTGTSTWYDNSYRPTGYAAVHLATANPMNMPSPVAFNWPAINRPGLSFSKVYQNDGTTLTGDQHSVQPGQIAEYDFETWMPDWAKPGQYKQELKLVVEGLPTWNMLGSCTLTFNVTGTTHAASYYRQSAYPVIPKGQTGNGMVAFKNTGTSTWYDDTARAPSGQGAVHLAITNPINHNSEFALNWPAANRPNKTFTKVYEADGTTLAADQHSVQPGQIAQFEFQIKNDSLDPGQIGRLDLTPVLEGTYRWQLTTQSVWLDVIGQ